jgi:hypothetical protein
LRLAGVKVLSATVLHLPTLLFEALVSATKVAAAVEATVKPPLKPLL